MGRLELHFHFCGTRAPQRNTSEREEAQRGQLQSHSACTLRSDVTARLLVTSFVGGLQAAACWARHPPGSAMPLSRILSSKHWSSLEASPLTEGRTAEAQECWAPPQCKAPTHRQNSASPSEPLETDHLCTGTLQFHMGLMLLVRWPKPGPNVTSRTPKISRGVRDPEGARRETPLAAAGLEVGRQNRPRNASGPRGQRQERASAPGPPSSVECTVEDWDIVITHLCCSKLVNFW